MPVFGVPVKRVEDRRLLVGDGEYVDDVRQAGALHVAVVRSVYAHARIGEVRTAAAAAMPGVVAVETARSLGPLNGPFPHPTWFPPAKALQDIIHPKLRPEVIRLLADDKVRYVGEPVAIVVATDPYLADDAARAVEVDYETLPVVVDPERAAEPGSPLLNDDWGDNLAAHFVVDKGDVEAAFERADRIVRQRIHLPRSTPTPIENRGVVAVPDRRSGGVTVWSASQQPHWLRDGLERVLGIPGDLIRVVAPDVGGGFGIKSMVYPEELIVPTVALRLDRTIRWTDTRSENFVAATHARDQIHDLEIALRADGTILGLRDRYFVDAGASNVECLVCPYNTAAHLPGAYRIPAMRLECLTVLTNKTPNAAARGAGRPEAVFAMEGILDAAADALELDRVELRRRNTLRADEMPYDQGIPYRDGVPEILDGGDYTACLDDAIAALDLGALRRPYEEGARPGRLFGVGAASYIEGTGVGPYESALIRIQPSGRVIVTVGPPSQGQSHETTFAQICAEELGVRLEDVRIVQGDTLALPWGGGTIASRTAVVVGNAIAAASRGLREKVLRAAADLLEVAPGDVRIEDGRVSVVGSPSVGMPLGQLAARVAPGIGRLNEAIGPGLDEYDGFQPPTVTYANGVHACAVEVDVETGSVEILKYVVVHDCGRLINPMVVEGQIMGGVTQGLGMALFEELVYDDDGQLLNGSLMDYGIPRATDMPPIEVHHRETPSDRNPLGIKGVGEAGAIPVPAAVISAVGAALRTVGAELRTVPVTPARVLDALDAASARTQPVEARA
ncbi:MAG TPA: xanthine dehydrogenase family protein molybdopterin-binding subunit [Candidatus Limnocylindrales bacterium]|nr:xanthine dehydrogenase family protein molybdopterin-binding subunit [Candidatus Limnocylindrales bacterium]